MKQSKLEQPQGYEFFSDEITGKLQYLQLSTGEIGDASMQAIPAGTMIWTPEEQEEYRRRKEEEAEKQHLAWIRRSESARQGNKFIFVNGWGELSEIKPQTVARLVYLHTYLSFEKNILMLTKRTPMQYKDLPTVLGLSTATINRFWEEISPKYLILNDDGVICTVGDTFLKGSIKHGDGYDYRKVYLEGIREMYRATPTGKHKVLGYLFQLLPYINVEYNLLCWNPQETEINELQLLSAVQFCELIDFNVAHISELAKMYNSLTFRRNGKRERFCAFIYDGVNKEDAKICINPRILYSGTNSEKVEVLGLLCAE